MEGERIMKIAVTGKGGVGKTTVAAVLARLYAEEGRSVPERQLVGTTLHERRSCRKID